MKDALTDHRHVKTAWAVMTVAVALGIGILTLSPATSVPHGIWGSDKVAHMVAFLFLVLPTAALWPRVSAMVGVLAVLYGGAIELIQPFTGRNAELADLVADGVGVGLGIILGSSLRRVLVARRAARMR